MRDLSDLNGARAAFERALKINEITFGKEHPQVAINLWWLGIIFRDEGSKYAAKEYFERALAIFKKFLPPNNPTIKTVQGNLDALDE